MCERESSLEERIEEVPQVVEEGKRIPEHEHPAWWLLSCAFCFGEEN